MPSQPRRVLDALMPDAEPSLAAEGARPQLVALLFCDWANVTADHKHNLIGVFDSITVSADDKRTPQFALFIKATYVLEDSIQLRIYGPDGALGVEGTFPLTDLPSAPDPPMYVQLLARIQFETELAGIYWFQVLYHGEVLGGTALRVKFADGDRRGEDVATA